MKAAYYNEFDEEKAEVIREAIKAGLIAPGDVDTRSITEVQPEDLIGYTQCHFFAGIGVWSYALRLAGWPDDRAVWTGSCPCPSFSCAGKGEGFDDPRHLWPDWFRLIGQCRPASLFGEQVEAAIGHGWLDLVQSDLESAAYAVGAAVLTAAGVGAPHIRSRLYFCAHTASSGWNGRRTSEAGAGIEATERLRGVSEPERLRDAGICAHTQCDGRRTDLTQREAEGRTGDGRDSAVGDGAHADGRESGDGNLQRGGKQRLFAEDSATGDVCDTEQLRRGRRRFSDGSGQESSRAEEAERRGLFEHVTSRSNAGRGHDSLSARLEGHFGDVREWRGPGWLDPLTARSVAEAGATRGFWRDCDWWYGRDGKYRPIEPGVQPLAHGAAARVLKLRCYGDAINPWVAKAFIESFAEATPTLGVLCPHP